MESESFRAARELLDGRFQVHQTRRYVILSDADADWTRVQAERLERAYHQYNVFIRRLGLEARPLRHKLVCILFERSEEYRTFAQEHDGVADHWISGHYSPRFDRIAFYRLDSSPEFAEAHANLAEMQEELDRARQSQREAQRKRRADPDFDQRILAYERQLEAARKKVAAAQNGVTLATTVHEAIHQLLFHTGVQSTSVQYPLWICEGLATAFETDDAHSNFGPGEENPTRRAGFVEAYSADKLLPLRALAAFTRMPSSDTAEVKAFYDQSFALVTWLVRHRRTELRRYLESMQKLSGRPSPEEHLRYFTDAFGDPDALERSWLRHETSRLSEQGLATAPSGEGRAVIRPSSSPPRSVIADVNQE